MRGSIIRTIVHKDVVEFTRNRFFVFMTLLVLIVWVALYWVLPDSVEENISIGVHLGDGTSVENLAPPDGTGLTLTGFASGDDLREAVEERTAGIVAGIDLPAGFAAAVAAGEQPTARILIPASVPADQRRLVEGMVNELAFALAGVPPPVDPFTEATILGVDRTGDQVSLQQQMRPLMLVIVLMVETFALASLVAAEVQQRTVVALLASPAKISDILAAKGAFGTTLAFSESALLGLLIGAFAVNASVVIVALLLGSILVTGVGLLAGAFGRDFLGTLVVAVIFMIPLMIPAFGALFPGSTAAWVKVLPSYGLVDTVVGTTAYGEGWADAAGTLGLLAAWGAAAFTAGAVVLRRRVVTL